MDVGVRELKAHLSAYLRRAAAGEVIIVTERGQPVATIGPVWSAVDLDAAAGEGWVTRGPDLGKGLRPVRRHRSSGTVAAALAEDRSE